MNRFKDDMRALAESKASRIVLALDIDTRNKYDMLKDKAINLIKAVNEHIIAVKINMHLLLPLSRDDIRYINHVAHEYNLKVIADLKLNDIPNTNKIAIHNLADMNFDAFIINPFIGYKALEESIDYARLEGLGVITLVFMSHKGVEQTYGLRVDDQMLYDIFLQWSNELKVDGIVVGATYPEIIRHCYARSTIDIYSPGIATQGGDAINAIKNGVRYLIVGRSIINSHDPSLVAKEIKNKTWKAL